MDVIPKMTVDPVTPSEAPLIKKPYQRQRVYVDFTGVESVTDTSFGNDTDVNNIVARFSRTGELPQNTSTGQYCDVTNLQEDLTVLLQRSKDALAELDLLKANKAKEEAQTALDNAEKARQFDELIKKQAEALKPAED